MSRTGRPIEDERKKSKMVEGLLLLPMSSFSFMYSTRVGYRRRRRRRRRRLSKDLLGFPFFSLLVRSRGMFLLFFFFFFFFVFEAANRLHKPVGAARRWRPSINDAAAAAADADAESASSGFDRSAIPTRDVNNNSGGASTESPPTTKTSFRGTPGRRGVLPLLLLSEGTAVQVFLFEMKSHETKEAKEMEEREREREKNEKWRSQRRKRNAGEKEGRSLWELSVLLCV